MCFVIVPNHPSSKSIIINFVCFLHAACVSWERKEITEGGRRAIIILLALRRLMAGSRCVWVGVRREVGEGKQSRSQTFRKGGVELACW